MKSRYHALQVALNRPFQNGFLLKGAYTLSRSKNMADEDGWTGLTWNHPAMYDQNFALAGFDRTHVFQLGWVWELPFLRERTDVFGTVLGGWQVNGIFAAFSGTPYSIGGSNPQLDCQGCGSIFINVSGDPTPVGSAGSETDRTTTRRSSRSRRAPPSRASATAAATASAARPCGTWTSRRSRRSRSAASVRSCASRR
jgi:hypothetical protein